MHLSSHLTHLGASPDLVSIIEAIAQTAASIPPLIHKNIAQLGTVNATGDTQLKIDVVADQLFIEAMQRIPAVMAVASEEREEPLICNPHGSYGVAFDPIDGSKMTRSNSLSGSIAAIYPGGNFLQSGRNIEAALYVLYGPATTLVCRIKGKPTQEYLLSTGMFHPTFQLHRENLTIGDGKNYCPGGRRREYLDHHHAEFIEALDTQNYRERFFACGVADTNFILHEGGIFTYPCTEEKPEGVLRLLFEAAPLAFIMEGAGGRSSDGSQSLLDIVLKDIMQRTPVYLGDKKLIERVEELYKKQ